MLPLAAHCPDLARHQTRVVELAIGSTSPPPAVAFVERHCERPHCNCRRVILQLVDLEEQRELAAVGCDLDSESTGGTDRAVYFERTSQNSIEAHLLRAIVEGFIQQTNYRETLEDHHRAFREAVESGAEPNTEGIPAGSNGHSRPLEDYADRIGGLSLDDVRDDWIDRAESPGELNRILHLFYDSQRGYGSAFDAALTMLDGLGIEVEREAVVEAAETASSTRSFPEDWRPVVEKKWTLERPLVEDILPLVAETLWDEWCETPRPHLITKQIANGYEARYDGELGDAWNHWKTAWEHVEIWLEARGGVGDAGALTERLDDALDIAESTRNWLQDLGRLTREMVRDDTHGEPGSRECLDLLTSVASALGGREEVVCNNIDVARYATLCDMNQPGEARCILAELSDRPTEDSYAGLFLADMISLWDYEATDEDFQLVLQFIDRTLEIAPGDDAQLLSDVRNRLEEYR